MSDERPCRFCGESILVVAKKCKHCGEWLDQRAQQASRGGPLRWAGDRLVVAKETLLPDESCFVCGTSEAVTARRRQFVFTPSWVYFGLLGGVIPLVILALIGQRKGKLDIPVCGRCHWRSVGVDAGMFALVLVGFFAFPAALGGLGHVVARDKGFVVGLIAGFAALVGAAAAYKAFVAQRMQITCERIEGDDITLRVPSPSIIQQALRRGEAA